MRPRERWAHRVSYRLFRGAIPSGHQIHHSCGMPSCVNPQHLQAEAIDSHRSRHGNRWLFPNKRHTLRDPQHDIARLLANSIPEPNSGCWLWTAAVTHGYGAFSLWGESGKAHRASYALFVGEIPEKTHVHHMCGVRCCINPRHLRLVSDKEHAVDFTPGSFAFKHKRATACPKGHSYDAANTSVGKLGRSCKACDRIRHAEALARANAKRTECKRGHAWTPSNVIVRRNGVATCRQCASDVWAKGLKAYLQTPRRKPTCHLGHPLSGENAYVSPQGRAYCKTCRRASDMKRRHPRREEDLAHARTSP